jgi:peptide/nickel transport system permease protein
MVVLLLVSAISFALLAAAGGDALTSLRGDPLVSEETIRALRHTYELDRPLPVRYINWLGGALSGNLGQSIFFHAPVAAVLKARLLNTLLLAAATLLISWSIALAFGSLAARRPYSWLDRACSVAVLLAFSIPRIVLALAALALALRTSLFSVGSGPGESAAASLAKVLSAAVVLSVPLIGLFLAQTRAGLRAALNEDFVRVARAKGLPERTVIFRHAVRAALNPLITIFGCSLGGLISGAVIVETVLGWPGMGQLTVIAVQNRDVPVVMGVVVVSATAVLVGNLIGDLLLRLNDPRLRGREGQTLRGNETLPFGKE